VDDREFLSAKLGRVASMSNDDGIEMTNSSMTDVRARTLTLYVVMPHAGLSDEVNRTIAQSEIEGGVHLDELSEGAILEVETQHHSYRLVNRTRGQALMSGHPNYCPEPVPVRIAGSTWGGSMLKLRYIGRGMQLEFCHPTYHTITTSRVVRTTS
jgi:hypothetical protein